MTQAGRAVVFAYHDVGVRCLSMLLAHDVDVALVVTHSDNPGENIFFASVAELAGLAGIPVVTPDDPNTPALVERLRAIAPDWLFSFYYRHMLDETILGVARVGAFNMHGSLLPKYRGRVPINWAVLHGESETGATLHRMELKPDAGARLSQRRVPILPNDTAHQVFGKVVVAAELALEDALPGILRGDIDETPLELSAGSYFGGRTPEDGRVSWHNDAWSIHNLIRAVAPPYPGAFCDVPGDAEARRLHLLGSYYRGEPARGDRARLYWERGRCHADCIDGERLLLTALALDGAPLDEAAFRARFGEEILFN